MSDKHVENSLDKIRTIFKKAQSRIDAIPEGGKIPATQLAEDIAKEHGMTGPQLYPTLKFLLDGYPGVDIRRGAHGGIFKLVTKKDEPAVAATPVTPNADNGQE